ncbi:MAG: single-stranded DNA-binding protein [Sphingobacteriia bacterium]|nr:single-stranded DNA-binding protein [Sphingobacteriia bacterium]
MAGVNKAILVGNLGRDPEIMTFENNVKKATFSLATTESYRDKDGNRVDQTEWHNIVLWRGLAEIAEKYLRKGSSVYLEGKIKTRSYEQNGIKKYVTEIFVDNMQMLGKRDQEGTSYQPQSPAEPSFEETQPTEDDTTDDLPF